MINYSRCGFFWNNLSLAKSWRGRGRIEGVVHLALLAVDVDSRRRAEEPGDDKMSPHEGGSMRTYNQRHAAAGGGR